MARRSAIVASDDRRMMRSLMGRHRDFWGLTDDGLIWASKNLQLELTAEKKKQLMEAYLSRAAFQAAQPPGPVQRQTNSGPAGSISTTIDVAHELGRNELLVSLFDAGDQSRRVKAIWLIERDRLRVLSLIANDGRVIISGGKIAANNRDAAWINKCRS